MDATPPRPRDRSTSSVRRPRSLSSVACGCSPTLLSHLHGDHFDRVARRGLDKTLPILTTRHAARHLRLQGFRQAVPMKTWQSETLSSGSTTVRVTSLPGRHTNGPLRKVLPPVMRSLLELETAPGRVAFRRYHRRHPRLPGPGPDPRPAPGDRNGPAAPGRHQDPGQTGDDGRRAGRRAHRADPTAGRGADPLRRLPGVQVTLAEFQQLAAGRPLPTSLSNLGRGESLPLRGR